MADPVTPNLIKAEVRFTWNDQQVENVLHFRAASAVPDNATLQALATIIDNSVLTDWIDFMAASVTYREVYLETYQGLDSISHTLNTGGVGTAAGESMAGNNTFCLSLRTAFIGRARRGRFYTIGMTEAHQTAGVVTSAYRDGWLNALRSLRLAALDEDFAMSVASFTIGGLPRVAALVTPINAIIAVDDYCDSQRRRLQGRGA